MKTNIPSSRGTLFLVLHFCIYFSSSHAQSSIFNSGLTLKNPTVCLHASAYLEVWIKPGYSYELEQLDGTYWSKTGLKGQSNADYWAKFEVKATSERMLYRVAVIDSLQQFVFSNAVEVVGNQPRWILQPKGPLVCAEEDARIQAQTNSTNGSYQWMKKVNGIFSHLTESIKFKGVNSSQLTIKKTINGDDATQYILLFKDINGCEVFSDVVQLSINQSGTIRPTASQTVCESGSLRLETTNFKGEWKRTEWAIRDSLGVYSSILDSTKKTLFLSNIALKQTHFRAEPFFETYEIINGDTIKSECGIKIYRNYTITPKPKAPDSLSMQSRCGVGNLIVQGLANEKYAWFDSVGKKIGDNVNAISILLTKPDSLLFRYAKMNEKGCLSNLIPFQVVQHPNVEILLDSLPDICSSDSFIEFPLLKPISPSVQIFLSSNKESSRLMGQNSLKKVRFPVSYFQDGLAQYTLFAQDSLTQCEAIPVEITLQKHSKIPPFPIIQSQDFCLGEPVSIQNGLSNSGNRTNRFIAFEGQKMGEDSVDNLQIPDFQVKNVGVYQFVAENSCEIQFSNSFELTTKPIPFFLEPQFPTQICRNEPFTLSVSVNNVSLISSYVWKVNEKLASENTANYLITSEYMSDFEELIIHVQGVTTCGDTIVLDEKRIQVLDIPIMSILDSSYFEFCTSYIPQNIIWPFVGTKDVFWYQNDQDSIPLGNTFLFTPSTVGTVPYFVQGTGENGCKSEKTRVDMKVSPNFDAHIVATNDFICSTGQLNKKAILLAQVNSSESIDYQWLTDKNELLGVSKELVVDSAQVYELVAKKEHCRVKKTINISAKKSDIYLDILSNTIELCSETSLIFGLPSRPSVVYDWYLSATSPNPFFRGDTLKTGIPQDSFTVFIAGKLIDPTQSCESDRKKITFSNVAIFETPVLVHQKCRGNTVNFEMKWRKEPQEAGVFQWQRRRPDDAFFTDIVGELNMQLTVRSIGNSSAPSGTKYRLIWRNESCELQSAEILLLVNQFTETLPSQLICENSFFELKSPKSIGNKIESSWQYRATNSGSWSVWSSSTIFPSFPDSLDGYYFRNRVVFATSDDGTCVITSDDGRVQLQRMNREIKVLSEDCGIPLVEIKNHGTVPFLIYLNGQRMEQSTFRLKVGNNTLAFETSLGCKKDTTWFVNEFVRPSIPINQTPKIAFTNDSLLLSASGEGEIAWFLDSLLVDKFDDKIPFTQAGTYTFYLVQRQNDCWSEWEKVIVTIKQSLIILREPLSFGTCEGRSARFSVEALGSGTIRYQWQMRQNSISDFMNIDSLSSITEGAGTAELRWRSVGNSNYSDLIEFRCLILDENDTLMSRSATLQAYSLRGALLPNKIVCEGNQLDVSIDAFRTVSGPVSRMGWQKNSETGWTFVEDDTLQSQLFFPSVSSIQEGSYRFSVAFRLADKDVCVRNSDTFTLKVGDIPSPPIVSVAPFCQEEKVVSLSRLPGFGTKIRWYSSENDINSHVSNPSLDTSIPGIMQWYIREINEDKCESKPVSLTLLVNPTAALPVSTTPNPLVIKGSATFSANGENLKWYRTKTLKDFSFDSPIFTKKGKANYYVTATNQFGCESERVLIQTELVNSLTVERQPVSLYECEGNLASFTVRAASYLPILYTWYQQKNKNEDFQLIDNQTSNIIRIDSSGSRLFPDSSLYVCRISDTEAILYSDTVQLITNKLNIIPSTLTYCLPDSVALTSLQIGAKGKVKKINWETQTSGKWTRFFEGEVLPTHRIVDSLGSSWRVNVLFESEGTSTCSRTTKTFQVNALPCFYEQDSLENRCLQAKHLMDSSRVFTWLQDSLAQTWGEFHTDTSHHGKFAQFERKEITSILQEIGWFPSIFTVRHVDSIRVHLFLTTKFVDENSQNRWYKAVQQTESQRCEDSGEFLFEVQKDSIPTFLKYGVRLLQVPFYIDESMLFFRGVIPESMSIKGEEESDSTFLSVYWDTKNATNVRFYTLEKWNGKSETWDFMEKTQATRMRLEKSMVGENPVLRLRAWLTDFAFVELGKDTLFSRSLKPFCLASPNPVSESGRVRIQTSLQGPLEVLWIDLFGRRRNVGRYFPLNQFADIQLPNTFTQTFTLKWIGADGRTCENKMMRE